MSALRGAKEFGRFQEGKRLTYRQSILAHCYACNGETEGGEDCEGTSCIFYPFMPYHAGLAAKRARGRKKTGTTAQPGYVVR